MHLSPFCFLRNRLFFLMAHSKMGIVPDYFIPPFFMLKITLHGKAYSFDAENDKSLMEQLVDQGVDIMAACGGSGLCTTCAIVVKAGHFTPRTEGEDDMCLPDDQRLSCQCRPQTDADVDLLYS